MSPLSAIYAGLVHVRNSLYDREVLKARRLSRPVVSVGSVSAGGAGKTPFVILLGELLRARGIAFDVLSRGYGRQTRGVLMVGPNGAAEDFGDEPLLIARRLGCPVVVGEDRYLAGKFAEEKFGERWHLLDDGFQHRRLARDFDIALLTTGDVKDHFLPEGRLREPLASLNRADAIVLIDQMGEENVPIRSKPIWRARRGLALENPPVRPVVFCGIARPNAFLAQLRAQGMQEAAAKFYKDHHKYAQRDIGELKALSKQNRADGFITTEKDEINLGRLSSELGRVTVGKVTMELEQPNAALDTLLRVVAERRRQA